ncbi:vitamin K epoxide reductase family protein [Streptomyces sp. TE5632]
MGAGRRTGLVLLVTGLVGRLASFQLAVDDWRSLDDPAHRPACDISPVVGCGSVMSSPRGNLFGFPDMPLGLGAFAAVAVPGVAALTGARLHRGPRLALGAGALAGVVFVHRLIARSLYELNELCPYCAVVWTVTVALFRYVTVHCLDQGVLPAPRRVPDVVPGRGPGHPLDAARCLVRRDRRTRPHPLLAVPAHPAPSPAGRPAGCTLRRRSVRWRSGVLVFRCWTWTR